jgi:hypothetical protein
MFKPNILSINMEELLKVLVANKLDAQQRLLEDWRLSVWEKIIITQLLKNTPVLGEN